MNMKEIRVESERLEMLNARIKNMPVERNVTLDVMKGIAIIIVVANHASMPILKWSSLIELSIFFIASGYCYNSSKVDNIGQLTKYIWNKLKSLYFPCLAWSSTCTVFNNFLVNKRIIENSLYSFKDMIKQLIKCCFFSGGGQLSGTIWFLRCLFIAIVLYSLIDFSSRKIKFLKGKLTIISIMLSLIGWLIGYLKFPGYQYFNSFTIMLCLDFGKTIKEKRIKFFVPGEKEKTLNGLIIISVCVILLAFLRTLGAFSVRQNQIINPLFYYCCALLGWILLCDFSNFLCLIPLVGSLFQIIGRHTLSIMLFHFSAFKIATEFEIIILNLDKKLLISHPTLLTTNGWWLVYTCIGVLFPLGISLIYSYIRQLIKRGD